MSNIPSFPVEIQLTDKIKYIFQHFQNPWRRAYHVRKKAAWLKDDEWCDAVQLEETYYPGTRRILDVIDMHILDFLITNQDRHHYEALA